tara:strand:- start:209 stop:535 length:327 start_codon:yes stop_codon:yes gene_type:complete
MALLHWKLQRLSAIILVPAIIYIVIYFLNITQFSYSEIISDITSLWGMLFIVFVSLILFTHSSLGIETIMEDYIHDDVMQRFFITLSKVIHVILLIITLVSLMMIKGR